MILGFTGHRSIGGSYSEAEQQKMWAIANRFLKQLPQDTIVISGMAIGWDMEVCSAALANKLDVWAYIPFKGQELKWPQKTQEWYFHLLNRVSKVVTCSEGGFEFWKLHYRNECIVRDCDQLVALWNGEPKGGTYQCVNYANKVGKPVLNLWEYWESGKIPPAEIVSV